VNELALFAGAGGGILGGKLLGWRAVCAVELDAYCRRVLLARQRDGFLPRFPIWDNITTFDGNPWRGRVDVVSGGFPCTDISAIGRGAGIEGKQSGLWREMARIVGEVRPRFVFVENSPLLVKRGLALVIGDLAELGYDARWGIVGADDAGFAHHRKRLWLVGHALGAGLEGHCWNVEETRRQSTSDRPASETGLRLGGWKRVVYSADCDEDGNCPLCEYDYADCGCPGPSMDECQYAEQNGQLYARPRLRFIEPDVDRVAHGVAARVDRLKAIGNGQVPAVAALAWRLLGGPSHE
jgi:DNA (cytosine-5)-methyltransferase 1